jgi:AhpD family alkylhydroperoxidase
MAGHMTLYKYVLHHPDNTVPKWFLETIGVWVSLLNRCRYCVDHHAKGLERLLRDPARAAAIRAALESGEIETGPFEEKEKRAKSKPAPSRRRRSGRCATPRR